MLQINGKTFMNLQEAVQWLLDNNALPFQSSANYIANTEIGLGTIVNPSPAKVRIGSLIFFADSKVSTVTGLTENGFIVSDQYNDLVDDVVYVSNVQLNASGHLIVTLSNGDQIDAGLIKQVSGFSINASQHLIVSYNDGTSTDLGAIFSGNVSVSGYLSQGTPNYSGGFSISVGGGLTAEVVYSRVEEINKVLYIIFNYKVTNNTGSSVTIYNKIGEASINVNSSIGEAIIDFNGHSLHDQDPTGCVVTAFKGSIMLSDTTGNEDQPIHCVIRNNNAVNQGLLEMKIGSYTIADNTTVYVTGRCVLTLL